MKSIKNAVWIGTIVAIILFSSGCGSEDIITKLDGKSIQLKAFNNMFLGADGTAYDTIVANRKVADAWETFALKKTKDNFCTLSSHKNLFLSADLGSTSVVTAFREQASGWETFEIIEIDDNHIALKASNSLYLTVDEKTGKIYANANSFGKNETFELFVK